MTGEGTVGEEGDPVPPGMRPGHTVAPERDAVLAAQIGAKELGWFFREQPILDYGVDAHLEVVSADGRVSGRNVGLQIKGGDSYFDRPTGDGDGDGDGDGWTYSGSLNHLSYWLGHSLPVVVVLVTSAGDAYWQHVSTGTVTENQRGFTMVVPRSQRFGATAREPLTRLAGSDDGVLETLAGRYGRLPPDTGAALARAAQVDRLAAARLAERLDTGRFRPDMTVSSLTAAAPSWLSASAAAQDLWLATASYATEHGHRLLAAPAFESAADAPGGLRPRMLAFAGLTLVWDAPARALELLTLARSEGAALLADVGLALLDVPANDARPMPTPAALLGATDAELDAEPTILNYLGEMAVRRGDLDDAVELLERASAAAGGRASGIRLGLARAVFRRMSEDGFRSPAELRRATAHARAAVEERRRWDGPSGEALETYLDILFISDDAPEAIAEALPRSAGGRALEVESRRPGVARIGATAALAGTNEAALHVFLGLLGDGPERREVDALTLQLRGADTAAEVSAWTSLMDEAPDDAAAARFLARLARLGIWPDRAQDLLDRSVLAVGAYDTLHALFVSQSGDPDAGARELRRLATDSPLAAVTLVDVLQEHEGAPTATTECRAQLDRWADPMLVLRLIGLLREQGLDAEVGTIVDRLVTDETHSVSARLRLVGWLVSYRHRVRQLQAAVSAARKGLAVGYSPDLAWNLVVCLYESGEQAQARSVLTRYRPEPGNERETRLWMELHVGEPPSVRDATVMADLARQQSPGPLRSAIVGMLAREVLHTPGSGPFPEDLLNEARTLVKQVLADEATGGAPGDGGGPPSLSARAGVTEGQFGRLLQGVWEGRTSISDVAAATSRRYGSTVLQRPAGVVFAGDWRPALRAAGRLAADEALRTGQVRVDLTTLAVLSVLHNDEAAALLERFDSRATSLATRLDVAYTVDDARSLVATATAPGGQPREGGGEPGAPAALAATGFLRAAERLKRVSERVTSSTPQYGDTREPAASVLELAGRDGVAVWADDTQLRARARAIGVAAFGTLDLLDVLDAEGPEPARLLTLAAEYVVDLPLRPSDIVELCEDGGWAVGPAHAVLSRPGWWRARPLTWEADWETVAVRAAHGPVDALNTLTSAALQGATAAAPPALVGERFRQVLVVAVIAQALAVGPASSSLAPKILERAHPSLRRERDRLLHDITSKARARGLDAELLLDSLR